MPRRSKFTRSAAGRTLAPLLLLLLLAFGCGKKEAAEAASPAAAETAAKPGRVALTGFPAGLGEDFSGARAHRHVAQLVAVGPRPPSSSGYQQALRLVETRLGESGWRCTRQTFLAETPAGLISFTNLLARLTPPDGGEIDWQESTAVVIGGHLDSKAFDFPFVGANDGGSSTGILIELARVLAADPAAGSQVELVFFDGEEAFRPNITPSDGLYGSKHYAGLLSRRASWPSVGIVLDIVGDPNHELHFNPESPAVFQRALEAALPAGFPTTLRRARGQIVDDHLPLQATGLPCLHLIGDFQRMDYWHRPGDTLDKVDPEMLGAVGRLTLDFLTGLPAAPAD